MMSKQSIPAPRRRDRIRTRAALLDAAAKVFASKGFAASTLDEISEAAGFTRGAFHHHFASKEELFLAVIARHDEELLAGYEPSAFTRLRHDPPANAARWHELHARDHDDISLRLELRLLALRDAELRRQLISVERAATAATTERLTESVAARGEAWRYPPDQIATLLHLMSGGLRARAALGESDTVELMETFLTIMWEGSVEPPPKRATKSRQA